MFTHYHAHVYFDAKTQSEAEDLCHEAKILFPVELGRFHTKKVGPHPCWSCQIAFNAEQFPTLIPWLNLNRKGLTVLVHPLTDNSLKDHEDYAMWLGDSKQLNLKIFR